MNGEGDPELDDRKARIRKSKKSIKTKQKKTTDDIEEESPIDRNSNEKSIAATDSSSIMRQNQSLVTTCNKSEPSSQENNYIYYEGENNKQEVNKKDEPALERGSTIDQAIIAKKKRTPYENNNSTGDISLKMNEYTSTSASYRDYKRDIPDQPIICYENRLLNVNNDPYGRNSQFDENDSRNAFPTRSTKSFCCSDCKIF